MAARLPLLLLLVALLATTGCLGQEIDQVDEAVTAAASPLELEPAAPTSTSTTSTVPTVDTPSANIISTGVFNPARRPPRVSDIKERHPVLTAKPDFTAMTDSDLAAAFSGDASPYVAHSSEEADSATGSIAAQANGVGGATFSDSRFGSGTDYTSLARARVGRLMMRFGGQWSLCSASVINKALVVTAAHCVCKYGQAVYPDRDANGNLQVYFEPGLDGTTKPYGTFWAKGIMVPPPYEQGFDVGDASAPKVVVNNDVALVWLGANSAGKQVADAVGGYFGYGWNAWSFSAPLSSFGFPSAPASSMLTQFGYPAAFDSGNRMQIGHAATYVMSNANDQLRNYIRGSAMTGGSSGGPWIANYGMNAALNAAAGGSYGSNSDRNIILATTSWGYSDSTYKVQGASMFGNNAYYPAGTTYGTRGTGNIAKLMFDACDNTALTAWNLKSKGFCI